jgi:ABC-2 type transport system ATP-binding protein
VSVALNRRIGAGLFGGEGFILQRVEGDGLAFLTPRGRSSPSTSPPGEQLRVDTGCLVAMQPSVVYDIRTVPGIKTALFGGEGLFFVNLTGRGAWSCRRCRSRGSPTASSRRRPGPAARGARRAALGGWGTCSTAIAERGRRPPPALGRHGPRRAAAARASPPPRPPAIETRAPAQGVSRRRPRPSQRAAASAAPGGPPVPPRPGPRRRARDVVALEAPRPRRGEGEFFGLLGPNGAGKSTTLGVLTTRVLPTSGEARVAGADVVRDPVAARLRLGVVPQRPNPDRQLTVEENLLFHAAYFGVPGAEARRRAAELLERFRIGEARDRRPEQLSGGQQQRLMIARALIHEPRVLFLDEPTVGLDPQARLALWDVLRALHADGRTIVMTTHYMEEADRLCDRVAIVDGGRLLTCDTPAALARAAPGGTLVELALDGDAAAAATAARAAGIPGVSAVEARGDTLRATATRSGPALPGLLDAAERAGRAVHDVRLVPPSLESLFVSLTGRSLG